MLKPSTHHVTTAGNKAALLRGLNSFIYLVIPEGLAAKRLYAALLHAQTFNPPCNNGWKQSSPLARAEFIFFIW